MGIEKKKERKKKEKGRDKKENRERIIHCPNFAILAQIANTTALSSLSLSVSLCLCLSLSLSICLSLSLYLSVLVYLSICVSLSVCLSWSFILLFFSLSHAHFLIYFTQNFSSLPPCVRSVNPSICPMLPHLLSHDY